MKIICINEIKLEDDKAEFEISVKASNIELKQIIKLFAESKEFMLIY